MLSLSTLYVSPSRNSRRETIEPSGLQASASNVRRRNVSRGIIIIYEVRVVALALQHFRCKIVELWEATHDNLKYPEKPYKLGTPWRKCEWYIMAKAGVRFCSLLPPHCLGLPPPRMHVSSSSLISLLLSTTAVFAASSTDSARPSGFVHTIGQNFAIDGKPFFFAGTNAYWFQFLDVSSLFLSSRFVPSKMTWFERTSMT